jgi:molybdopterin converting factor small subunit
MSVRIIIPTPLRAYAGKQDSVELQASTVGEALMTLTTRYHDLRRHLYADDGRLRSFVNIYVNDEDVRYLQKDDTPLKQGDTVSIVPSIAGGSCRDFGGRAVPALRDCRKRTAFFRGF